MFGFTILATSPRSAAAKPPEKAPRASLTLCLAAAATAILAACAPSDTAAPTQPANEPTLIPSVTTISSATAAPTQPANEPTVAVSVTKTPEPTPKPSPVAIPSKPVRVKQVLENGLPQNKSEIRIQFPDAIANPNSARISVTSQVLNLPGKDTIEIQIPIASVNIDSDGRTLIITTARLVSQGGQVTISDDALLDVNGNFVPEQNITLTEGATVAQATMDQRPFTPTDKTFFTKGLYAEAGNARVAPDITEQSIQQGLSNFLNKNASSLHRSPAELIQLYNSPQLKAIVPDANLRAGLISLDTTDAYMALDAAVNGNVESITFEDIGNTNSSVLTDPSPDGKPIIRFHVRYKNEPFQAIGALLAHEIIAHTDTNGDGDNGIPEEVAGNTIDTYTWAQMLLQEHSLAAGRTPLVRNANSRLFGMLNSGKAGFPNIGIEQAPGVTNAFPGSIGDILESFMALVRHNYSETSDHPTEANSLFAQFLKAVSKKNDTAFDTLDFNDGTLEILDLILQNGLSTDDTIRLAQILKLQPADPTITSTANNN